MRYFLDTNALVAFGNGDRTLGVLLRDAVDILSQVSIHLLQRQLQYL